jgi:hypothetical protein
MSLIIPSLPRQRGLVTAALVAGTLASAPSMFAQGTPAPAGRVEEFGIDAGAIFGLGKRSSVQITLPAARARLGFFLGGGSRWSIEPAAFVGYSKVKDVPSVWVYNVELGALYHFRPGPDLYSGRRAVIGYLRPFIGENGTRSGGTSNNEFSAGAGLGALVPWRTDVAFRGEANFGYGFHNNAARIGAFLGLSFFTR